MFSTKSTRYKKISKLLIFFLVITALPNNAFAQTPHKHLRKGNTAYDDGNFTAAEESYRKALEQGDKTVKSPYNLGNAIYQQKRYDEALKHYENALTLTNSPAQKAKIHYNMGNTYMAQKEYKKGIEAYKNALRLLPNDPNVQHNLSVASRLKRQQEKEQQPDNNKDNKQNKDPKKDQKPPQGDNQAQGKQDPKNENKDKQKPQQTAQKGETSGDKPPQTADSQPAQDLKHDQARELLRIMDNEERKVQEKVHKAKGAAVKNGKDW
ncbi:MAG: hypothetical protein RI894_1780 [Bacteroidota bacterium]|jgi:tetratricopeptide (TPR) repeat protein